MLCTTHFKLHLFSTGEPAKISKSAQKKLDAKAAKEAKKAARAAELAAQMSAVTIDDFAKESYGVMKMIQSTEALGM